MKLTEVRKKAAKLGIKTDDMKKVDLIRTIQNHEGNIPCFQTGQDSCSQLDCCWRSDCLPTDSAEKIELNKKEIYLHKIKTDLEEFKNNVEALKETAQKMLGKSKTKFLEEIKRLEKKSEEEIKQRIHTLAEASEEVWEKTKQKTDHSWEELIKTLNTLVAKFGNIKK